MEDSKLWWYIILGAIYFFSKFLKKKKAANAPEVDTEEREDFDQENESTSKRRAPSSIEDILKELTEQSAQRKEVKPVPLPDPIPERKPQQVEAYSREPRPLPLLSTMENIEAVREDEEIDIVPHKQMQRDRPVYERSTKFAIKEEQNDMAEEIHDLFQEEDGPRKAIILSEILNRRY
ncbi:hypothetical protein [Reichenbachiella sp. MALMAid0571]|uniref:hypothetical protein n=1 Tax=Reichenbachiella sp. MALMAid0571 TaxID=3143939 RepID=UPI0032DFE5ED